MGFVNAIIQDGPNKGRTIGECIAFGAPRVTPDMFCAPLTKAARGLSPGARVAAGADGVLPKGDATHIFLGETAEGVWLVESLAPV
jgi:hypothetical protein